MIDTQSGKSATSTAAVALRTATDPSFTIAEFCAAEKICRASFYNLKKQGKAPRLMLVGNQTRIRAEARADWHREREAEAAAAGRS